MHDAAQFMCQVIVRGAVISKSEQTTSNLAIIVCMYSVCIDLAHSLLMNSFSIIIMVLVHKSCVKNGCTWSIHNCYDFTTTQRYSTPFLDHSVCMRGLGLAYSTLLSHDLWLGSTRKAIDLFQFNSLWQLCVIALQEGTQRACF